MRRLQVITLFVLSAVAMRCGGPPAPPTIASFKATPESIIKGKGPVNLSWEVYGSPDTVLIDGMEPILRNEGDTMIVGNSNVNPSQTTTYRLYASNEGGSVEQTVTVTVKDPPPPPPTLSNVGDMLTFNTSFAKNGKITDESDLSRLVNLLKEKENLVVEITAFADASTPAKKQKAEAMKRAAAVRSYLVKNKIAGNRVVVGKGMSSGKIEAKVVRVVEPKAPKAKGKKKGK